MGQAFVVCGSPGAGKTTYGKQLAKNRQAVLLDIDLVTEKLVQVGLSLSGQSKNDRDSEYFKQTYRETIYETLFDNARLNLQWMDVVIVGPFTKEVRMESWLEILQEKLGSKVEVHYIYCAAYTLFGWWKTKLVLTERVFCKDSIM